MDITDNLLADLHMFQTGFPMSLLSRNNKNIYSLVQNVHTLINFI